MSAFSSCAAASPSPARLLAPLLIGSLLAGCSGGGDELPRQAVSGEVTFDGTPLASGMIQFEPTSGQATGGGAVISDGSYEIPADTGLVPGTYKVSISSAGGGGGVAAGEAPGAPGMMMEERIPDRYNTASELTAEVTDDGDNTFDFALQP